MLGWSLDETQHRDIFAAACPDPKKRQLTLIMWQTRYQDGKTSSPMSGTAAELTRYDAWLRDPMGTRIGLGQDITDRKATVGTLTSSGAKTRGSSQRLLQSFDKLVEHFSSFRDIWSRRSNCSSFSLPSIS